MYVQHANAVLGPHRLTRPSHSFLPRPPWHVRVALYTVKSHDVVLALTANVTRVYIESSRHTAEKAEARANSKQAKALSRHRSTLLVRALLAFTAAVVAGRRPSPPRRLALTHCAVCVVVRLVVRR